MMVPVFPGCQAISRCLLLLTTADHFRSHFRLSPDPGLLHLSAVLCNYGVVIEKKLAMSGLDSRLTAH